MKAKYILFGILILALILRLPHLIDKEYGTDEEASIFDAKLINDSPLFTYIYNPNPYELSPPLFFHILALALIVYDSVITLKILMVIFGMLGIIIFYFLARNLFDKRFALFATFIFAINPMHIIYSQHIRSYIFIFLLYTLSLYFLQRFIFEKNNDILIPLGIIYLIAIYTHFTTAIFMVGGFITVLISYYLDSNTKIKEYFLFGGIIFVLAIPSFLLLQKQFAFHNTLGITNLWPPLTLEMVLYPFWKYSIMLDVSTTMANFSFLFALFPLLIGISAYSIFLLYKRNKQKFIFIVSNIFMPFLMYTIIGFIWPVYSFRYLTYLLPLYVMLYSYGLFSIKNRLIRIILTLLLIAGWIIVIFYYYHINRFYLWPEYIGV